MKPFKGENILHLVKELPDDAACKAYLARLKWHDGFTCSRCGHNKGCEKADYKYHCYACQYVERATANTLFHKVKFGLHKAFCIVFEMTATTKSLSSIQMGKRYGIRQSTAWFFMQKVGKAMQSGKTHGLSTLVHVEEFTVGGKEPGKPGRRYDTKKKKAVIAVELSPSQKVKRVYIKAISDYGAESLTRIFQEHIGLDAKVFTDKWRGYAPLKEHYTITQRARNGSKDFKALHRVIQQLKSWIRAIPTHVSKKHIQGYFDAFCFRINRSLYKATIFHKTLERRVAKEPVFHKQIKCSLNV